MRLKKIILAMSYLLLWGGSLSASALPDDTFDPQNPEEPSAVDICRIKVSANPAEGAYVSGGGKYKVNGNPVWISTNACNTEDYTYTFKYWTQNGEVTSYSQDFWFYPTKGDFEFVAHYEKAEIVFDPNNPAEPSSSNIKRKYYLYLTSNLEGACSFNMNSGDKIEEDRQFYVYPYYNSSYYKFEGWKVNGQIISTDSYLYYTMSSANTTLEACFSEIPYDPENPVEPSSQGVNVDNSTRRIMDVSIGNSSGYVDKTRIVLNEKRSIDYESDCDASKFTSNTAGFQIYSIGGDVKYSINERPLDNGEIPLGIIVKNAGSVTIGATRLECSATLVDKVLNKEQDLALGNYTFDSEAGTFDDRFYIRIAVTDALTITAKSYTRAYGEANPTFEYTSTGAVLKGYPSITCEATPTSDVGTYDIVVSKGSVSNTYVTYVNGILTITAKTVDSPTITLSGTSFTYDGNAKEPTVTVKDGETIIPATEYSVSYSNNTNAGTATVTITDVEGGNYTVSGTATFTITKADGSITAPTAKSGLVYSGSAQNLIDAGSSTTGTVKYSLDDTTYDTAIPQGTDAGKYTVYYKVEGDANHSDVAAKSLDVTIAAKTVASPTITLGTTSYTYDGTAKEPTVTVKDGETTITATEYSVSYTNNTNVGTATVTITDVEGGNYTVSGSATFAISSADGSLTPPVGKSDLVYNGSAQDLITAGTTTSGTIKYSLDDTTYDTAIPQGTNAAKYTVYYKVEGDANHSDVAAQSFDVTIAAKTVDSPTITLSATSYTYDGTAKEPTVTVKDGETTIPATEYSVSYSNNTNAGTATVTITDVEGGNYTVSGSTTFTISSADGSLTPPVGKSNLVYSGSAQDLITAGSTTTGTIKYSLDGTTYDTAIPQGTDAGKYTVYYMVEGDANHGDVAAQSLDVTIAAKTVASPTITLGTTSYTYDGTAKEPTVTVKDGETTITATEYSVSYTNNINVGTATVTITDAEGGNYTVSGSATFAISSADGSLTPPTGKSDLVYNGSAQDLITAGSTTTGTIKYSLDGTTYDTAIPQGTNAGKYTVYYKVEGDANHGDVAAQSFDVTIAKASLAVSVGEYTITEGDDIPTFTITYDGFKNNETVEVLTTAPTVTCNATKDSKAGEYEISISGGAATNYEFSYTAGKLIIKQKEFEETVEGGDNSNEGVEVTFAITNDDNDGSGGEETPTVAVSKGSDVSGECIIPDKVTHGDKTYEVTEIAAGAFENNEKLESVTIPESVETIRNNAFSGCTGLQSIKILRETPIDFSSPASVRGMRTRTDASSIFDGVNLETCILYVPESSVDKYKVAEVWKEFKNILPISSTGIGAILNTDGKPMDVYNLNGRKVKSKATSLDGLPKGVYIVNGKKIVVK